MRQFFAPADAPLWLKGLLNSIRDALADVWNTPLRLKDYATADLPPAADWTQGLVYDVTVSKVKYSDGSTWSPFAPTGEALTRVDDTNVTLTLGGTPASALLAATSLTLGWSGTLAVARGGTGAANAADARTNLGLGTAAVKSTGTSGDAVPLLNAANTWSGKQTISVGAGNDGVDLATNDARLKARIIYNDAGDGILYIGFGNSGTIQFHNGAFVAEINGNRIDLQSGKWLSVAGTQVVAARKTGWSVDTGTSKRTANATYTAGATLTFTDPPTAAEMTALATRLAAVEAALQDDTQTTKALKDDLHNTAGHGLIGT
jgi:hypothetical protein